MRTAAFLAALIYAALAQDPECVSCKAKLKPNARFCTGCGAGVAPAPAPAPPDSPPGPGGPPPDQEPERVKKTQHTDLEKHGITAEQVNRAIDRGAAFLAKQVKAREKLDREEDYLSAYALIHTRAYHSDAKLRQKIVDLLRDSQWLKMNHCVYVVGLRALALEASQDLELQAMTAECAQYLVDAQGKEGTWTYKADLEIKYVGAVAPAERTAVLVAGGEPLDEPVRGVEIKRRPTDKGRDGDNSCTQFALLGLHAAAKCGFSAPRETWQKALEAMEKRHSKKEGGWDYAGGHGAAYGSMTCAGICSIALCRYYLGEKEYLEHDLIKAGLSWLARNFTVETNPPKRSWEMYYLYSIERVGVFCSTEKIGEHEWYPLGAKRLIATQRPDGSWQGAGETPIVSTGFALLFLTRATAPVRKERKRGGTGWLESHALNEFENFYFILDASGSMREEMESTSKFEIAQDVVESVVKLLPEGAQAGLRVYGHRYNALDARADTDSELVIPVGPLDRAKFVRTVRALKCLGKTPITHSLTEAARDLASLPADVDIAVILLTDGEESTRGANPIEAASKLAAVRKGLKLHVVGFDIGNEDGRQQLEKVAAAGGGRYLHALDSNALGEALAFATIGRTGYVVLDRDGKEVHRGKLGDRRELPEGKYRFVIELDGRKEEREFWVNTEATTRVTVNMGRR